MLHVKMTMFKNQSATKTDISDVIYRYDDCEWWQTFNEYEKSVSSK